MIVNHFKSKGDSSRAGHRRQRQQPRHRRLQRRPDAPGDQAGRSSRQDFAADARHRGGLPHRRLQLLHRGGPDARPLRRRASSAIESDDAGEESYSFGGLSGSLDHVLGNAAAKAMVTGRRHLGHQRRRVRRLPVQPLQLQRHAALRRRRTRSRPPTTTRRSSASTCPTTTPTTPRSRSSARTTSTAGSSPTAPTRRGLRSSPGRSTSCGPTTPTRSSSLPVT